MRPSTGSRGMRVSVVSEVKPSACLGRGAAAASAARGAMALL